MSNAVPAEDLVAKLLRNPSAELPGTPFSFSLLSKCSFHPLRPDSWDITAYAEDQLVGYSVVQRLGGLYRLQNPPDSRFIHEGMLDEAGWALEVHPEYQGRGLGKALLSLAVGTALADYALEQPECRFVVQAGGIVVGTENVFRQFGFVTIPFFHTAPRRYLEGTYTKMTVPPIVIRDPAASAVAVSLEIE